VRPTFIVAGTLPAGTGHLYGLLIQHPEVYLAPPMQPECNFFFKTAEYEKGLDYYEQRWFSGVGAEKAVGERSSLLLSSERAPARVARDLPGVKLIFLLRNPVDRAYANYRFTALAGYEDMSFEDALANEERRMAEARARSPFWGEIQPHAYFHRGRYFDQVSNWLRHFPREQILLMRSDELLKEQNVALRKVYTFLGVDTSFVAADFQDMSSPAVRDVRLQAKLRAEHPGEFDQAVQRLRERQPPQTPFDDTMRANVMEGYEKLSPELRASLTARYADQNRRLADLVPFSIDDWL
jgi:hypothetical protein